MGLSDRQLRVGMFGWPPRQPNGIVPDVGNFPMTTGGAPTQLAGMDPTTDLSTNVGASPVPAPAAFLPLAQYAPVAGRQCPLVQLNAGVTADHAEGTDLRFSPAFAAIIQSAAAKLAAQGIVPHINEGFRTAADQKRMREGGSRKNPAALYSDHQLGNAIDLDGTKLSSFPKIVRAFQQAGALWGGNYRDWKDRPHFYVRPVRATLKNTATCERENPR